jgi:hypothetical protein
LFPRPFFPGADNRLSENEAVEEIKQLAKQLQSLYDRIPQRGPATNVILTLLDICRAAQNSSGGMTLKPPPLPQPHEQAPKLSICNGSSCGVDKETNTSFDNLAWQQLHDSNCRFLISDKCDNDNHLSVKECSHKSKCCEANNTTKTINCSTSSINFDNLQLQCMCSSDNNSLDEYPIDNCDNCSTAHSPPRHQASDSIQSGSFRERLLNIARPEEQHRSNNLRKRNSELVLGTNFDSTSMSGYKAGQSYRISCDNIFSNKTPTTATRETNNNKSNHSLSTESDRITQIPYSFLERPTMKMSQSEDRNLRELKIALSSSLPSANKTNNSTGNKIQLIGNLKNSQITTQQSQSCTSSSSTSSKVDKFSSSLSGSSTSDAIITAVKKPQQNETINADMRIMTDETNKQRETEIINNQNDNKSKEDNKMITATSKLAVDNKTSTTASNVNNKSINNANAKKRKTPEGKLAIDLNDRSKYTDEVSV